MWMPWKTTSVLLERERFALGALRRDGSMESLCGEFGISRKTAYKWLARYRAHGRAGLGDRARAPKRAARQKPAYWKQRVEGVRRARPHWGAKKIHRRLRELYPRQRLPVVRTLGRWLVALGLVRRRPRRARRGPPVPHPGLTRAVRLHQVWTVDFKGWFRTGDGQRQEPLSVREATRRYLLEIRLLADQSDTGVRQAMTRLFRREGLPRIIRVDNGAPFGGKGALGLSRLSVWWLRLGIRVEFTRRARPGDNAAHEQMHGRYQAEIVAQPAQERRAAQRHPLIPATILSRRLEPEASKLAGDIGCGDLMPARAGPAPFEQIVGEEFDMAANARGGGGIDRRWLRGRRGRDRQGSERQQDGA